MFAWVQRVAASVVLAVVLFAGPAAALPSDNPREWPGLMSDLLAADRSLPQSLPGTEAETAAKVKCDCWVCNKAPYKRCKKPAARGCPYLKNVRCGRCCFNYK